jgi:hypothetical protein
VLALASAALCLLLPIAASALDPNGPAPVVVISIASGGGTEICDTNDPNDCLFVVEEDLILCNPLSMGLPITACDWEPFFEGDANDIQLNTQVRAADIAPNGNLGFVALTDKVLPGIGTLLKTDIGLFAPDDVFQPYLGGGPYTNGAFKLYLNGDLTQQEETTKPWDALEILSQGGCEEAITIGGTDPHSCPILGSLTSGSGSQGLGGVHFANEDILRCLPSGFALNGAVEACDYALILDASNINADTHGTNNGIKSDIEAIDLLSFDPNTMSGTMVFKKAFGNPPDFPSHEPARDLLLYEGTFGAGSCSGGGKPCADENDCPGIETCDTGTCAIGGAPCATDEDCDSGDCNATRFPTGDVSLFFDGSAVGLAGTGQKIEAFTIVPDADSDRIPDGVDNCPDLDNPPSICSDGTTPCPSGLSSECPPGETCTQPDSDNDDVGDPCDQCNGRDDAVCFCGDKILDLPSEQCDLGNDPNTPGFNGDPNGPCSGDCRISGQCTGSGDPCQSADDCPPGQGCCGNAVTESPEECDDGNSIDDDLCTSQCLNNTGGAPLPPNCEILVGPNIVQALVKPMKVTDTKKVPETGVYDKWILKGDFNLVDGIPFDPENQIVRVVFSQEGILYDVLLDPDDPNNLIHFRAKAPGKPLWKFEIKDANGVGAEGWQKGQFKLRGSNKKRPLQQVKYNLKGKGEKVVPQASFPVDLNGLGGNPPNNIRVRETIIVGSTCATRVVTCEQNTKGTSLKCFSAVSP